MSNIYELTNEFKQLEEMFYSENYDEQAIKDTLEGIEYEIEVKAENTAKVIKNIDGDIKALKEEEKRLADKRRALENKQKTLKEGLENAMRITGKIKFKTDLFGFNIQKNAPSLDIETEDAIPKDYYIEQAPKLDKKTLLKAIKSGLEVKGVGIKQSESLRIR